MRGADVDAKRALWLDFGSVYVNAQGPDYSMGSRYVRKLEFTGVFEILPR